ncbi:MAG: NAD(P)H-dependent glycerol-3-phosphate dehydrogenase [Bacteroidota bacterium]
MNVAVIGAGSWGTALSVLLWKNGHTVRLWTYSQEYADEITNHHENLSFLPGIKIPEEILVTTDFVEAAANKDMVVFAVPTQFLRSVATQAAGIDFSKTLIVHVAKGIEHHSLKTMSEVLIEVIPTAAPNRVATLSGPSHAEEVSRNIPTAVVAAATNGQVAKSIQQFFMNRTFRVYTNTDLRGVELGGALKNVIAIAAGISDGAGYGDNTKAALMTRGIAEITRLGVAMGANPHTFSGLSGVGDLFVTCMSRHSRNRFVGEQIGKGRRLDDVLKEMVMIAEGVETARSTTELSQKYKVGMPIFFEVHKMLFEGKNPHVAVEELMTRDAKEELEH